MSDFDDHVSSVPFAYVSYAREDNHVVLPLLRWLQNQGFCMWYDDGTETRIGWTHNCVSQLKESACVIAFVSRNYGNSTRCLEEIRLVGELNKDAVAVFLEQWESLPEGLQKQIFQYPALYYDRYADAESFLDALSEAEILKPCFGAATAETTEEEQWDQFSTIEFAEETDVTQSVSASVTADERQEGSVPATEDESDTSEMLYQRGLRCDVRHDFSEATKWYRVAAQQGHIKAQYNLGRCLYWGIGGVKCVPEGVEWIKKAALTNEPTACFFLGKLYEEGKGVAKDVELALSWYRSAKQNGYTHGIDGDIARCERKLKPWWKR